MYTCYSGNPLRGQYIIKDNISENQFSHIKKALIDVQNASGDIDYWALIDQNIIRMKEVVNIFRFGQPEAFVEINGAFANLLSAYYLWKCYNNHKFGNSFQKIHERYKTEHVECYLIDEMRNYLVHNGFIISSASFDVLNEMIHFNVKPQDIIDGSIKGNHKLNAKLKKYLDELNRAAKQIDIIPLIDKFQIIYSEIQVELWRQCEVGIRNTLQILFEIAPKEDPDIYNTYLLSNENNQYLNVGHILYSFVWKANKYYPDYLKNIVTSK